MIPKISSVKTQSKFIFLFLIILLSYIDLFGQCKFCGNYKNKHKDRIQTLSINPDYTFEYKFNGIYAGLMYGNTTGTWKLRNKKIILNSAYSNKDYTITEKKVNHCHSEIYPFLMSNCDSLIRINIKNINDEYVWFLKRIMLNEDTSKISNIIFENLNIDKDPKIAAFFIADKINSFVVFNSWYDELEIKIENPNSNDITVKGNFSDSQWYTYFVNEEWKLGWGKLKGNKNFGDFKRVE